MTDLEKEAHRLEEKLHLYLIAKQDMERQAEVVNKLLDKVRASDAYRQIAQIRNQ